MSSHIVLLRVGHLKHLLRIFRYLGIHHNLEIVYNPTDPAINKYDYKLKDWTSTEFGHIQGKEVLPPNMPETRGLGLQ